MITTRIRMTPIFMIRIISNSKIMETISGMIRLDTPATVTITTHRLTIRIKTTNLMMEMVEIKTMIRIRI